MNQSRNSNEFNVDLRNKRVWSLQLSSFRTLARPVCITGTQPEFIDEKTQAPKRKTGFAFIWFIDGVMGQERRSYV